MEKITYKKLKIVSDAACRVQNAHKKGRDSTGESACGIILLDGMLDGKLDENDSVLDKKGIYLRVMTNNQAEYNGLIKAMEMALEFCDTRQEFYNADIEVWMDSKDVINQMKGEWKVRSSNLKPLYEQAKELEKRFSGKIVYFHHPRTAKWAQRADRLANEELNKHLKKK